MCNQKLSELVSDSDFLVIILVDSETLTKRQRYTILVVSAHTHSHVFNLLNVLHFHFQQHGDFQARRVICGPLYSGRRL